MYENETFQQLDSSAALNTLIEPEFLADSQILQVELEQFFQLSSDLLCIAGTDGYFKHLNPAWTKILGYSKAELLAKPYLEFVHPEDRSATIAEAKKLKTGCQTVEFQNRYCCKDGSYRWLSWNSTVVTSKQLIYCIARDITESKEQEKAFRENERQLRLAFEAAGMGSWNWNIQTGQIRWSDN
ncbi:PAS domain-containing protein [Myxosarcina sp. GI1(2024)]